MKTLTYLILTVLALASTDEAYPQPQKAAINNSIDMKHIAAVVAGNNRFAINLYAQLKNTEDNVFFSPYSISTALAMVYEGARAKTANELESVFNFPSDNKQRRNAFKAIQNQLNNMGDGNRLSIANALWVQNNYKLLPSYISSVQNFYASKVQKLDFVKNTANAEKSINQWVANKTNNRITDIIGQGTLPVDTQVLLTNAIYFKGNWADSFEARLTESQDFYLNTSIKIKALLMHKLDDFSYMETDNMQLLEIPYKGNKISMWVILPKESKNMPAIEKSLSIEKLKEWRDKLEYKEVNAFIPKFKFRTNYNAMDETLQQMGVHAAFSPEADFSGITPISKRRLAIDKIIHQTFIEVNEKTTEAAAATVVVMADKAAMIPIEPPVPILFRADHPFIFIIQDIEKGSILFLGKVNDPTKK